MSRLYGTMSGEGKRVTKCGHRVLGATVNGWSAGIHCGASVNLGEGDKPIEGEHFYAGTTGGSNNEPHAGALMCVRLDGTVEFFHNGNLVYTTKGK